MQRRTRNLLFGLVIVLFFIIAPMVILYARGYNLDTESGTVIKTGIITIDTNLSQVDVSLDNEPQGTKNNPLLLRNLRPGSHRITLRADGYEDWEADLPVYEEKVTRVENLILFYKDPVIATPIQGPLGVHSVSSNNKYIIFSITSGKDEGLWLHTADQEKNRQLLDAEQIDVQKLTNIRWSDNSKVVLLTFKNNEYGLSEPHVSAPTFAALPDLNGLKSTSIYFDQDEPTNLFYLKDKKLFRLASRTNADPELLSDNVVDLVVRNPKVFMVVKNNAGEQLASLDLRVANKATTPIIALPENVHTAKLAVSNGLHIAVKTTTNDLLLLQREQGQLNWAYLDKNVDDVIWSPDSRYLLIQKEAELWVFDQESLSDEEELYLVNRLSQIPDQIVWHPQSNYLLLKQKGSPQKNSYQLLHVSRETPYLTDLSLKGIISEPQLLGNGDTVYYRQKLSQAKSAIISYTFTKIKD